MSVGKLFPEIRYVPADACRSMASRGLRRFIRQRARRRI